MDKVLAAIGIMCWLVVIVSSLIARGLGINGSGAFAVAVTFLAFGFLVFTALGVRTLWRTS